LVRLEEPKENNHDHRVVARTRFELVFAVPEARLEDFKKFCTVNLNLTQRTIDNHEIYYKYVSKYVKPETATFKDIQDIVMKRKSEGRSTANLIKFVRVFYGKYFKVDWAKEFKLPPKKYMIRCVPSREQLIIFYCKLPNEKAKTLFLMYASSGLRLKELLKGQIYPESRTVIPAQHEGRTKNSYISFFNEEAREQYLKSNGWGNTTQMTVSRWFMIASKMCEVKITPQILREWFCNEMGRLGVPDRYVDAFCGRVPSSVLARHYTDYSPERLKEIYDKTGLKVLDI